MQSSLPAGWLAFTGRASNPLDHNKRFQITHPPFLDLSWRYREELPEDLHSKRLATDADYWMSWLERLAEIRRESDREALLPSETPVSAT
jgi:hypothetical protein